MKIKVGSVDELSEAANKLIQYAGAQKVFLFYGDMGAGKTTFIKAICEALGVSENTSSPTFSIVNEYPLPQGPVYHFDFYRLKTETEALDLGYEDYFYSGNYCFIEWPEKIPGLIPEHFVKVNISVESDGVRIIHAENY
ncbi:MAG: tsaE [Sphingobacteriaceae bacterium]|jgi:tRNA threonylcarbamoyladenosine biosynthesis protein TsaE|nr:tsaE [Sphingobacteriaceae bacterium]